MSEQSPGFDDEFREAIEQSFGIPSANENELGIPPENEDESSGQDEVPDIM